MYEVITEMTEVEYETLPRAVRAILNLPRKHAHLVNIRTEQRVHVDISRIPHIIRHVAHGLLPEYEGQQPEFEIGSVVRFNERHFLNLVANQVRRFTGMPVKIKDSDTVEGLEG